LRIDYGGLVSVYGVPVRHGDFTFMPADVALEGTSFSLDYPLEDHNGVKPFELRHAISEAIDAAWVRARIPSLFGNTPETSEAEKSLLYAGFVAVDVDCAAGYPFVCTDHYGRSALMFSDDGPEEPVKRSIARAFWSVLLQEPVELTDFEERIYHPGASIWLTYGCESGRVYCDEADE
jgi:hypothetical protein